MPYLNSDDPTCSNCNKSGLAILPVRYAVVPNNIMTDLPAALGNKVTDVKLEHHKYVLRTLRQGFVYIYHEKHPRGSQIRWEVYSVSTRGTLWKQQSKEWIINVEDDPTCSRSGHNIPASVFAIEKPEQCGKVWIAFSEHEWSEQTFKQYAADVKLRERRMQTFSPSTWISAGGYKHGLPATEENVALVIEYQDSFAPSSLIGGTVGELSKPDGTFDLGQMKKETTRHAMAMRKGQKEHLVAAMKKMGEHRGGKPHAPIIIALWDAVGITHELNGFRNDAAGRIEQYNHERALELSALANIEGLKVALEERAIQGAHRDADTGVFNWSPAHSSKRLGNVAAQRPGDTKFLARQADLCARWERDNLQKVPSNIAFERDLYVGLPELEWQRRMAEIDKAAQRSVTTRNPHTGKTSVDVRNEEAKILEKKAVAQAWPKYEKFFAGDVTGKPKYQLFKEKHEQFMLWADRLIDDRTHDLIVWLESKSFLDALTEFHPNNIDDSVAFDDKVGTALFGMNSSVKGQKKIESWIKEMKATESNLLWRAIALNNDEATKELNAALGEAEQHKADRTLATSINWLNYVNKSLKAFADTYKKCVSVANANETAKSEAGSKAFGVKLRSVNTRGFDALMMTAGDRVFSHVRINALTDHASEKIIQHIFSIRAFVHPNDSVALILAQAKNEELGRRQTLERLRYARQFLAAGTPAITSAQAHDLTSAWEKFKAADTSTVKKAIKDSRIALLVMLIEGSNFSKLIADCQMKGDAKSWWSLLASGTSITSALFDVASIPAKSLFGAESWSYQRIKGAGGLLSAGATAVGAVLDLNDALKARKSGHTLVMSLYILKSALGTVNVGLTVATTFTYAAPMIEGITGKAAIGTTARIISARAAAILGTRILFMCAGSWMTVGIFSVQVFIWIFSDDELQNWCSLCAFGNNKNAKGAFRTMDIQNFKLQKALLEVGLHHE